MLFRLLFLAVPILLASLLFGLHRRLRGGPSWLRFLHQVIFLVALAYVTVFVVTFLGLHLFGYQL